MKNHLKSRPAKRILVYVALSHGSERDFLTGIFHYLDTGKNWKVSIVQDSPSAPSDIAKQIHEQGDVDGMIFSGAYQWIQKTALISAPIPIVCINGLVRQKNHPLLNRRHPTAIIYNDNAGIGRLGLSHFNDCGKFNSYAFVAPDTPSDWADERKEAFISAAQSSWPQAIVAGFDLSDDLAERLLALPKPIAVLTACDDVATHVLAACEKKHVIIPRQIAVLGVDNDNFICRYSSPPLSSILPDHEGMGYYAAKALDKLMSAHRQAAKAIHYTLSPKTVVIRGTTGQIPPATTIVERAKELIKVEATKRLTISQLAERLHISRRLVELRFKQIEGVSIGKAIIDHKLEEAMNLMRTTSYSLEHIATTCGFADAKHLSHRFREKYGAPPRRFVTSCKCKKYSRD